MANASNPPQNPTLVSQLRTVLNNLSSIPYPILEAENTKKRASVAFILRVNPSYSHWPAEDSPRPTSLDDFFHSEWVQHGDPEVLFIKRASRKGDRWTSHIALPGGRRDPGDADDKAAAVRETSEEVGLDLQKYAVECGNLPQRLVTTHWGRTPLMVLCPYVFLLTDHRIPPLKLQPTEVASTHWVPLRSLLLPAQRTVVFEDVSSRLANHETGVKRWMLSLILGKMMFAAINLLPTESLHSFETPAAPTALQENRSARPTRYTQLSSFVTRVLRSDVFGQYPDPPPEGPLQLWGLTLGVVADFLDLMPPHNALTLWTYPTFTPLDVRFAIWLLTYNFKNRKRAELQAGTLLPSTIATGREDDSHRRSFGAATESMVIVDRSATAGKTEEQRPDETGFHGLGTGVGENKSKKAAVTTLLEGYYDIVRRAVGVALVGRASFFTVLLILVWRRWRARH